MEFVKRCAKLILDSYIFSYSARLRDVIAMFAHSFEVKLDSFANQALGLSEILPRCNAAGQIWNVRGKAVFRFLNHNRVSHFFSPACFSTLFRVPAGKS